MTVATYVITWILLYYYKLDIPKKILNFVVQFLCYHKLFYNLLSIMIELAITQDVLFLR